jgi:hypothetical protein
MAGNPRSHPALGRSTKVLTGDGGYRRAAEDERASWSELERSRGDWLVEDAVKWYGRLCNGPALGDLKLGRVKLYVGALLNLTGHGKA